MNQSKIASHSFRLFACFSKRLAWLSEASRLNLRRRLSNPSTDKTSFDLIWFAVTPDAAAGYSTGDRRFRLKFDQAGGGGGGAAGGETIEWAVTNHPPQDEGARATTTIELVHT